MVEQIKPSTVISNCSWIEIRGNNIKLLARGECQVIKEKKSLQICVGQTKYILKPGMPVVLKTKDDRIVFVFPSDEEGLMFGLSASMSDDVQGLKLLLNEHMWQDKESAEKAIQIGIYGDKLSSAISSFGKHGISAISRATRITKKGIDFITEKSKKNMAKAKSPVKVPEEAKANLGKAKAATDLVVGVSSTLASQGLEAAKNISDQVKPVVKDYMKKKGFVTDKPTGPKTKAAMGVGKQTVKSGLEIYIAMTEAAKAVLFHVIDATTELVDHRYGEAAGKVAKDVSKTVQNTVEISTNFGQLGLVKTAKKVVIDSILDEPSNISTTNQVPTEVKEDSKGSGKLRTGIAYDLD